MAGPLLTVTVIDQEVLAQLQNLPKKIRDSVRLKMEHILSDVREDIFESLPGYYLDPKTIQSGAEISGSQIIGFLESNDKGGTYAIVPSKARVLAFIAKSGDRVRTLHVEHPYLKGSTILARKLIELKPWIEDQLEDALIEAL